MRPKKVVLLVDADEQRLSVRTFLLETRGYRVLTACCASDALAVVRESEERGLDLLATEMMMTTMYGNDLIREAKRIRPLLPCLLFSASVVQFDSASVADAFLPRGGNSSGEFLDKVRLLTIRKRGPRPQAPPMATSVQVAA